MGAWSSVHDYFAKYGEIVDVVVMATGTGKTRHSRGFGFVTFALPESVEAVSQQRYHRIGDRSVEVKRALSRKECAAVPSAKDADKLVNTAGKWHPPAPAVGLPMQATCPSWPSGGVSFYDPGSGYVYGGWIANNTMANNTMAYSCASMNMVPQVPAGVPIYFGQAPPTYSPPHSPIMQAIPTMGGYVM